MHKITYINSHKRKKRFTYEIFGFMYSLLIISILLYYSLKGSLLTKMSNDLFITDYNPLFKPLYFILIFTGLLFIIFNIGYIGIFKTRLSYILYPLAIVSGLLLSLSGFLYGQDFGVHFFNIHLITYACYFLVLIVCFIFEKIDLSRYGSFFMRILSISCSSIYILYTLWMISGVFLNFRIQYSGYFQIFLMLISFIYIFSNSIYVLIKFESRNNIK